MARRLPKRKGELPVSAALSEMGLRPWSTTASPCFDMGLNTGAGMWGDEGEFRVPIPPMQNRYQIRNLWPFGVTILRIAASQRRED
jgi:hypothetical protein